MNRRSFIGLLAKNLIAVCARNLGATSTFCTQSADLPPNCPSTIDALLGVRPEHFALVPESPWRGEVAVVEPTGADTFVVVKTDAGNVTVRTSPQTRARPGDVVGL
jgi:multiple sugar transport system ATP-binding protein